MADSSSMLQQIHKQEETQHGERGSRRGQQLSWQRLFGGSLLSLNVAVTECCCHCDTMWSKLIE